MNRTDDCNQTTINDLPDEILLLIFQQLKTINRLFIIPQVCTNWSRLMLTYRRMMEPLSNMTIVYMGNRPLWNRHCSTFSGLYVVENPVNPNPLIFTYPEYLDLLEMQHEPTVFSQLINQFQALVIRCWPNGITWPMPLASSMVNMTSVLLYNVQLDSSNKKALMELGIVCPHLRNVAIEMCQVSKSFESQYFHRGFSQLQNFRLMTHYPVGYRFLDELLAEHLDTGLKSIKFEFSSDEGDRVIDVLENRLRGRVVTKLRLDRTHIGVERMRRFLANDILKTASIMNYSLGCRTLLSIKWNNN